MKPEGDFDLTTTIYRDIQRKHPCLLQLYKPWLDDPFRDYDTEPVCRELVESVMKYANE